MSCTHTCGRYANGRCKDCQREADRRWAAKYPERLKAKEKQRYLDNRDVLLAKNKAYKLRTGHGSRWQRAQKMGAPDAALTQRYCDACPYVAPPGARNLHLDHDHTTGRFRGVLCNGCNTSLGALNDDPERITSLAAYARARCSKSPVNN